MKKQLQLFPILLLLALTFFLPKEGFAGKEDIIEVPDLATLREIGEVGGPVYRVTGEVILTHQHGQRNQKYVQDAGAGMLIDDASAIITTSYERYDGITGLTGTLGAYNNLLQLIPLEDPGDATSAGNVVEPIELAIEDIGPNYQSMLIIIREVTFEQQPALPNFVASSNYPLYDETGTLTLRTPSNSANADYFGTPVPSTPRDLIALVSQFGMEMQVMPRSLADFISLDVFDLSFSVVDEMNDPIDDAVLTFGTVEYDPGVYVLENVEGGVHNFTIEKEGFRTHTGQVLVEEDMEVEVMLIADDPDMIPSGDLPWVAGDFDAGDFPPQGWKHFMLGDESSWTVDGTAAHHTFTGSGQNADNWLVMPAVELPEDQDMILTFMERNAFMTTYDYSGVMISTGSGIPGNEAFVEVYESDAALTENTLKQVNLSEYAGEIVYIAFVYKGENAHRWWVSNVQVEEAPDVFEVDNIAALFSDGVPNGPTYRITGEVVITHLQTAYRGQIYIQDASGAIMIDDPTGILETGYEVYDGIIGLTGTLSVFQNMLQLVPVEDAGAPNSTGNEIDPLEVTLSDFNEELQGMLVIVKNASFDLDESPATFTHNASFFIYDDTGEGVIRTPNSEDLLDYFGTPVPDKPMDIVGVIHQRNEVSRLQPRSLKDFIEIEEDDTSTPELSLEGIVLYPNPAFDRFRVDSQGQRIDFVSVFNLNGQLLTRTEGHGHSTTVEVSGLPAGLYLVQVVAGENTVVRRLQIVR